MLPRIQGKTAMSSFDMKIFFFSATGNSLVAARDIAGQLNAEIISIPKIMNMDKIHIDSERVGIVFPAYLSPVYGLPLIVDRFIRKIYNIGSLDIFAVCTCGGYECVNALPALKNLRRLIRSCGGRLKGEYSVRLPMNNLDYDHIPIPIIRDQNVIINKSKAKIEDICKRIISKKCTRQKFLKNIFMLLMTPMFMLIRPAVIKDLKERAKEPHRSDLRYQELVPLTDKSITVGDNCKGCGLCAQVCPAGNIKIVDSKPQFQHRCEMCFACDEWCPTGSIRHWSRAEGIKYHHPDVKLAELLR